MSDDTEVPRWKGNTFYHGSFGYGAVAKWGSEWAWRVFAAAGPGSYGIVATRRDAARAVEKCWRMTQRREGQR